MKYEVDKDYYVVYGSDEFSKDAEMAIGIASGGDIRGDPEAGTLNVYFKLITFFMMVKKQNFL